MKAIYGKVAVPVLAGLVALLVFGCGGDDGPTKSKIENTKLILEFWNVSRLPDPWLYQVWAFQDSQWIAGETFNLDANGKLHDTLTFADIDLRNTCDSLRVTFQRTSTSASTDSVNGVFVFLVAAIDRQVPELVSPAIGLESPTAMNFVFATPSDSETSLENELAGIWFTSIDLTEPGLEPLPELPDGWVYEGWAIHAGHYLPIGRFTRNTGNDQDCRYYDCQTAVPGFPGEDFLINLPIAPFHFSADDTVLISIEPVDDPLPALPLNRWFYRFFPPNFGLIDREYYILYNYTADWPDADVFIH
jgi:hypothetical protein